MVLDPSNSHKRGSCNNISSLSHRNRWQGTGTHLNGVARNPPCKDTILLIARKKSRRLIIRGLQQAGQKCDFSGFLKLESDMSLAVLLRDELVCLGILHGKRTVERNHALVEKLEVC